jgi:hypothetical protein
VAAAPFLLAHKAPVVLVAVGQQAHRLAQAAPQIPAVAAVVAVQTAAQAALASSS